MSTTNLIKGILVVALFSTSSCLYAANLNKANELSGVQFAKFGDLYDDTARPGTRPTSKPSDNKGSQKSSNRAPVGKKRRPRLMF